MVLGSRADVAAAGRRLRNAVQSEECRVQSAKRVTSVRTAIWPPSTLRSALGVLHSGRISFGLAIVLVATHSVLASEPILDEAALSTAIESIRIADLKTHVSTLASDSLQGREGGSVGGHAASAYLVQQLRQQGVAPAAANQQFVQEFSGGMRNILASVPGRDDRLRDEVVIVSAHFDHVGFGTPRNSRGPIGYIHNGADDNASGVAGLLEVVEAVRSLPRPPRRTLLFAFWDGEEKGLLGSKHWIAAPTRPLSTIKLVINADMIGRLRPDGVEVTGTRTARGLRHLVSEANSAALVRAPQLRLDFTWDMRADSDHHPFFAAGIPALMLHTGKHDDYHRPSDDADKINYEGTQQLARLMLTLALQAADADELPKFRSESRRETKDQQRLIEQSHPAPVPRLGLTWNSKLAEQRIVEVIEIAPQSPAAAAGFHIGDRVERFANQAVSEVTDFRCLVVIADREVTATVRRPGRSEPVELFVRLNGEPTHIGLTWRTDNAEPSSVILSQVIPHSAADLAGLKPLDRILSMRGQPASDIEVARMAKQPSLPMAITFEREGRIATTTLLDITRPSVSATAENTVSP